MVLPIISIQDEARPPFDGVGGRFRTIFSCARRGAPP
jgi:hypothetical protein